MAARFVSGRRGRDGSSDEVEVIDDAAFVTRHPAIWEYLTLDRYDDGRHRERATVLFLIEDGTWKACLNDRGEHRSCWVSGVTLEATLGALEASLASGTPSWRHYQPWSKNKKGRA